MKNRISVWKAVAIAAALVTANALLAVFATPAHAKASTTGTEIVQPAD